MVENALRALEGAAKETVRRGLGWALGPDYFRRQEGKTDPVLRQHPLDTLRRAAYHSQFDKLYMSSDEYPYVIPNKTLKAVIGTLAKHIWPKGTKIYAADEALEEPFGQLLKSTKWNLRAEQVVTEAALMGTAVLRSVYSEELGRWLLELKQREYISVETVPGVPDEITAVMMEWPINRGNKLYWKKERWTEAEYHSWPEIKANLWAEKPEFKDEDATSEPNNYGEIPFTLVPHMYSDSTLWGEGVVNEEEILIVKALIQLDHRRYYGHLKGMMPNPVRTDHADPSAPLDLGIGAVIDLQSAGSDTPAKLELLQWPGMPESLKDTLYDLVKQLYQSAGLKPPSKEEAVKPNTESSGVALRVLGAKDADTIETLRDNGYTQVLRHYEKILRMSARLGLPEFRGVNPDDEESYRVLVNYPDFFPPTDQEKMTKIHAMREAGLPAEIIGRKIAELYDIEDEAEVQSIIDKQVEKEELMTASLLGPPDDDL